MNHLKRMDRKAILPPSSHNGISKFKQKQTKTQRNKKNQHVTTHVEHFNLKKKEIVIVNTQTTQWPLT